MNNGVEQFILSKSKLHQPVLFALRELIIQSVPIMEEIKWRVPMFSYKGLMCFINVHKNKQPIIAFAKGNLLSNEQGVLTANDRQFIRHLEVNDLDDFNAKKATICEVLQEAILLSEQNPNSNWKK